MQWVFNLEDLDDVGNEIGCIESPQHCYTWLLSSCRVKIISKLSCICDGFSVILAIHEWFTLKQVTKRREFTVCAKRLLTGFLNALRGKFKSKIRLEMLPPL